jgi:hypothetical protein
MVGSSERRSDREELAWGGGGQGWRRWLEAAGQGWTPMARGGGADVAEKGGGEV